MTLAGELSMDLAENDSVLVSRLCSPDTFHSPIDIYEIPNDIVIGYLRSMLKIRAVERTLAEGREAGLIGGPVHLGVGQEAIAVGVSAHLNANDFVFGAHRSHSHLLALGSELTKFFSEILGRSNGHCKGMGGSMHLWDGSVGFHGAVPIVAGTIPIAVGAALSAKMLSNKSVAVAYLGDGACEEGIFHESLNLSRSLGVPVLFVVENNLYASHMHLSERQPLMSTARFAAANDIPYKILDGNDVVAVSKAASELIEQCREMHKPGFIEAFTYRWYGHVDWREDIDVGINRSKEEISQWKKKDPISRLEEAMVNKNSASTIEIDKISSDISEYVRNCWVRALEETAVTSGAECMDFLYKRA